MVAEIGKPGRPPKPDYKRAKTRTLAAYDAEWEAVKRIAESEKFKTPFDLFRELLRRQDHPLSRRRGASLIEPPRRRGA